MTQCSVAVAKDSLTRLIREAEAGEPVHITRRGREVAVLVSKEEFDRLNAGRPKKDLWQQIQEMRESPEFEPVELTPEEITHKAGQITELQGQIGTALERGDKDMANELYNELSPIIAKFPDAKKKEWQKKFDELKQKIGA